MADPYRIYGIEMSPYSVKVRSYFRYKGIAHRWIVRNSDTESDYQTYAKIQIVPLVVTPENQGLQDSTPIIEQVESLHPNPSIHPIDPALGFLSALLEEFGDEWGNKWMFHYRWAREVDQICSAGRLARGMMPGNDETAHAATTEMIRSRMIDRVWFVGSNAQNAAQIESTFRDAVLQLDAHLATRPYLLGGRPTFGDFGLWAQFYEAWTDPTPGAIIEGVGHNVLAWIHRMLWPSAQGELESWSALEPTLMPFLQANIGKLFAPWTLANEAAIAAGQAEFSVDLDGKTWSQKPQKYHVKSLRALRDKYAAIGDKTQLDRILDNAGCRAALLG